jgi:hypothetical protein
MVMFYKIKTIKSTYVRKKQHVHACFNLKKWLELEMHALMHIYKQRRILVMQFYLSIINKHGCTNQRIISSYLSILICFF